MKLLYSTTFFFLLFLNLKAQITTQKVDEKTNELKSKGVDSVLCYYVNCIGNTIRESDTPTKCYTDTIKYLFWIYKNQSFAQKFDNCNIHQEVSINLSIFNLICHNLAKIKSAKIKYPEYDEIIKGKKVTLNVFRNHSCHSIFEINIKKELIQKDVDDFALLTKYVDGKHMNKNYSYNQNSILRKLNDLIKSEVKSLEQ